jgi:hypothetical protein
VRTLKVLSAAALIVLEAGCGLPNPYFLTAPTASLAAGGSQATFFSPGYNVLGSLTTFVGFEVYYKFLITTPSGNDINLGGGGFPGPSVLQQNGYSPICLSTDKPPYQRVSPAIAIAFADSQTSLSIQLTVSSGGASYTSYAPSVYLGRYVSYTGPATTSKAFADIGSRFPDDTLAAQNYLSSDPDVSAIWNSVVSSQVFANLYVLAYGYEQGTTIVEYSTPVYLGYVTIAPFP